MASPTTAATAEKQASKRLAEPQVPLLGETTTARSNTPPLLFLGFIVLGGYLLSVCFGANDASDNEPPARPSVTIAPPSNYEPPPNFANIKSWTPTETDCSNLQSWFGGAANMHDRVSGDLPAMRWYSDLMRQIDSRLEAVGYDQ